ncbi:helix-turn-helix domain-containing protein [Nocardia camponoti]|uniref:HTH cro/C1-type domain-containing protein n=1 Tax=Nocardia camponoti TaxID=1616106 RepID=A0A917QFN2_9NOCA|nr:helix-turn-helix transcriptional regulator [Nocardia camponoti]GGK48350.1 hypothetical protein GCM10011591_19680 [Nocardia camponoti]
MTTWDVELAARVGGAVRALREGHQPKLSAAKLAEATERCGYALTKAQISDLELGRKKTVTVPEVIALALALNVSPVQLLYPALPDGEVEVWPGHKTRSILATQWFSGEIIASEASDYPNDATPERQVSERVGVDPIVRSRELERYRHRVLSLATSMAEYDLESARRRGDPAAIDVAKTLLATYREVDKQVRDFVVQEMAAMMTAGMDVRPDEGIDELYLEAMKRAKGDDA